MKNVMDLNDAVACKRPDLDKVKRVLSLCRTVEDVNDPDKDKRTAFMAAARGAGRGGQVYHEILSRIWQRYKSFAAIKHLSRKILLDKDQKHGWNVLMHAAKCGDADNLELVIGFYREKFNDSLKELVADTIDWSNVDHKVKDIINKKICGGRMSAISNYGRSTRSSNKGSAGAAKSTSPGKKRASSMTKVSPGPRSKKTKKADQEEASDHNAAAALDEGDEVQVKKEEEGDEVKTDNTKASAKSGRGWKKPSTPQSGQDDVIVIEDDPPVVKEEENEDVSRVPHTDNVARNCTAAGRDHALELMRKERDAALKEVHRLKRAIQELTKED
jgi:hypothetical protein